MDAWKGPHHMGSHARPIGRAQLHIGIIFSHPDYTVGSGLSPDQLRWRVPLEVTGLRHGDAYRRSGIGCLQPHRAPKMNV